MERDASKIIPFFSKGRACSSSSACVGNGSFPIMVYSLISNVLAFRMIPEAIKTQKVTNAFFMGGFKARGF